MKHWVVISLLIPRGFGEGISNLMFELGALGIEEFGEDSKWEKLKAYFPKSGNENRVSRALRHYLKSLQKIYPEISSTQIEITSIPDQNWGENWKRFFKPIQVTARFVVKPPWSKVQLRKGQMSIDITPGLAFGTGTHATTQLCIQVLEKRLYRRKFSVLDVGTGSGILSIAAARLGAGEVWGLDIDGMAVNMARENVRQNHVSETVKIRKTRLWNIQKKFDIVVANIDFKTLKRMRRSLLRHLKRRGWIILSGILEEQKDKIRQHYLETGLFQWVQSAEKEGWVCLTFKKRI